MIVTRFFLIIAMTAANAQAKIRPFLTLLATKSSTSTGCAKKVITNVKFLEIVVAACYQKIIK